MPTINWSMSLAGVIVGFVIGLTGMGGGALMTPVLVLLFGVNPGTAVSADVVTSLVLKPFGGSVHVRRGTVNWRLVRWLMIGSVPMAPCGLTNARIAQPATARMAMPQPASSERDCVRSSSSCMAKSLRTSACSRRRSRNR